MSFYQEFMETQLDNKDFTEIEVEIKGKKLPKVLMKNPTVTDIQNSGVLKGSLDEMGEFVVKYMIENLYDVDKDGNAGKNIFTAGNKDSLMKKWTPLHAKVYATFLKANADDMGNENEN